MLNATFTQPIVGDVFNQNYQEVEPISGDFVSMITHDLRAPLTNLSMFLNLTRSGIYKQSDSLFEDRLGQLIPELARINRLLDELIAVGESVSAYPGRQARSFNSIRLMEAAVNAVRHSALAKNISIVKECDCVAVVGDFDRLTRVIVNLLQNAIKFSPADTEIRLVARVDGDSFVVSVIDEGPGIPRQERGRIFQAYEQLDTSEKISGVGLGLSIAQSFIRAHGGEIGVKQREGGSGSHFWFSIPVK